MAVPGGNITIPSGIPKLVILLRTPRFFSQLLKQVPKAATEEASAPGKQQIDLIDGEEFITKLAEFGIGVHEVKDYEIDEDYFAKI